MVINVDLGDRVKVNEIEFSGNDIFKSNQLKKKMKKTKTKLPEGFGKVKTTEDDYQTDLSSIIDFYKEKGYRDARIISDTVITNDNLIELKLISTRVKNIIIYNQHSLQR